jgi:hypothetical protein
MNPGQNSHPPLFAVGQVVATPSALEAMSEAGQNPLELLKRHQSGDWGVMPDEDKRENDFSVKHGLRIVSAYVLSTRVKLWLITEYDRSVTTFLLPQEY